MYGYGACLFYVYCSECCVAVVVKDSVFFKSWSVELCCMFV